MQIYLVRHAHAGSKSSWGGHDRARPLSKRGRRQADGIADLLAGAPIDRLLSSPARRCVETLEPLAERLGIAVEGDPRLEEGARPTDALSLADELRDSGAHVVVCSHGDVIPDLLRSVRDLGARIDDDLVSPKASTWVIGTRHGRWSSVHYLPPPAP